MLAQMPFALPKRPRLHFVLGDSEIVLHHRREQKCRGCLFGRFLDGRIFAVSEDGDTFVMQTGPEFKVLGRNSIGEMTLASPAVANGSLILRTATKLYRITK